MEDDDQDDKLEVMNDEEDDNEEAVLMQYLNSHKMTTTMKFVSIALNAISH